MRYCLLLVSLPFLLWFWLLLCLGHPNFFLHLPSISLLGFYFLCTITFVEAVFPLYKIMFKRSESSLQNRPKFVSKVRLTSLLLCFNHLCWGCRGTVLQNLVRSYRKVFGWCRAGRAGIRKMYRIRKW
jgi:hypothetical protein